MERRRIRLLVLQAIQDADALIAVAAATGIGSALSLTVAAVRMAYAGGVSRTAFLDKAAEIWDILDNREPMESTPTPTPTATATVLPFSRRMPRE
jgi:hypothetical protein